MNRRKKRSRKLLGWREQSILCLKTVFTIEPEVRGNTLLLHFPEGDVRFWCRSKRWYNKNLDRWGKGVLELYWHRRACVRLDCMKVDNYGGLLEPVPEQCQKQSRKPLVS